MGNRPKPKSDKTERKSVLVKIGGIPVKELEVGHNGEINATLNVHLSKSKVDMMIDAKSDDENTTATIAKEVLEAQEGILHIAAPELHGTSMRLTKDHLRDLWNFYVTPNKEAGETIESVSPELLGLMGVLRSVYEALPEAETPVQKNVREQTEEILGFAPDLPADDEQPKTEE